MRLVLAVVVAFVAAPVSAFEPGSLGDAYRDRGYVQECTETGEFPGCTLIAGGSQFVIPGGGASPPEVLAKLRAMPRLSWVEFRGDIVNVYDSYAEFALGAVELAAEADPQADVLKAMQGAWQSLDDPKSAVFVDGLIWVESYEGGEVGRPVMWLGEGCADGVADGPTLELFQMDSAEYTSRCYSVVRVDANRMELIYLPRGNTLVYGRP